MTYNVNGLRTRVAQYGSLLKLLDSLDADIICFQETKLSRQDLSADITMAEGYEAFFSCTRTTARGRTSYSGVATFCRVTSAFSTNEVALPVSAEEGITGLLECSRKKGMMTRGLFEMPFSVEGLEDVTHEDLLKVDNEGRCVITDHGHFVLFNLYGPRAVGEDDERVQFKQLFFKILEKRWKSLQNQGRRVFVVGDLNIAPKAIDKCDADATFENNIFREWLRSLLREYGGSFFDVFRSKHPDRKEAYTCFNQSAGAEEFNYGSRIDHILIAGLCMHQNHDMEGHNFLDCHVEECDILYKFIRGNADNTTRWNGGRSVKLDGSDHLPVYVILNDIPDLPVHNTPPFSVRYIPEVRGRQQTIVSLLAKKELSDNDRCNLLSNNIPVIATENCDESSVSGQDGTISEVNMGSSVSLSSNSEDQSLGAINELLKVEMQNTMPWFENTQTLLPPKSRKAVRKKSGHCTISQLTIRSFFEKPKDLTRSDPDNVKTGTSVGQVNISKGRDDLSQASEAVIEDSPVKKLEDNNCEMHDSCLSQFNEVQVDMNICSSSKRERENVAMLEWQRIQQKMKMTLPLCRGHREPCVARSVKKGPNIGRQFYTCARAKGPVSNPEADCGHFQWSSVKSKKNKM